MRIVVAPDKLKGSVSAAKAAEALALGARRGGAEVQTIPLADGGEGTLDIWLALGPGSIRTDRVCGASGGRVVARWGLREGTALLESAEVVGGSEADRSVLDTTSYGVGELLRLALDAHATTITVALGGTRTSDAGIGMAQALGVRFDGARKPARAIDLERVTRIDRSGVDPRIASTEIIAACDVLNPLTGTRGAALLFGPQKGASAEEAARLDRAMTRFARLAGAPVDVPGSGAAGGLGFALAAFAGARLVSGADLVLDRVGFDERIRDAELVITAEGCLDRQSLEGKLVSKLAARAKRAGIPLVVIAGKVELDARELEGLGVTRAIALASGGITEAESERDAESLLAQAAERAVREHAG